MNTSASAAENEARQAASLRRIAIVLRDLPEGTARQLLAGLGPQARARVRHELANLVDVDPLERKRALESFTGSLKRQAARREDDYRQREGSYGDRLSQFGPNDPEADRLGSSSETTAPPIPAQSILGFLDEVADADLMEILGDEHPQTKAVVFASIEPARAARLLPRLGNAQRQDMLSRIGRLQSLPDEMLTDLATSFQKRVQNIQAKQNRNPLQRMIDQNAIDLQSGGQQSGGQQPGSFSTRVASAGAWDSAQAARHVPASAVAVSPRLQAILSEMPASRSGSVANPSHDEAAEKVAERLRRITRDESTSASASAVSAAQDGRLQTNRTETKHSEAEESTSSSPVRSTDEVHQELMSLPARQLCEALGRVDTRVAILALCGLPNETADAAIACLPRAQANQVRQHLMSLGSMEIREIDHAKDEVARSARVLGSTTTGTKSSSKGSTRSNGQELRLAAA